MQEDDVSKKESQIVIFLTKPLSAYLTTPIACLQRCKGDDVDG